jgi:5'-nucleotidase
MIDLVSRLSQAIEAAYPDGGTFEDVDSVILEDGTTQYMLYFSNGGRAAYQTGWTSINMERCDDIPFEEALMDKIALVDMDDTLCDYVGKIIKDLALLRCPAEAGKESSWGENAPAWIKARRELIKSQPGWWESLEPLSLGLEILNKIKEAGFKPHVLTKGPYKSISAWSEKVSWCRKNLGSDIPITITMDKGLVSGRVLVDDYIPYALSWLASRPDGLVIVPAQPWNEGAELLSPNILRIKDENDKRLVIALKSAFER